MGGNYTVTYCVFQIHAPPMILNSDISIYFFLVTACLAGCYCFSMSADRPLSEPEIALYSCFIQGHTVFLKKLQYASWDLSNLPHCMHTVVLLEYRTVQHTFTASIITISIVSPCIKTTQHSQATKPTKHSHHFSLEEDMNQVQ